MTVSIFRPADPARLSREELVDRIVGYASQMTALKAVALDYVREFDAKEYWMVDGIRSCAHWLSWQTGVGLRAAQDQVRVARALSDLPLLDAEFHAGQLSYSKVRAITRIADPLRDAELTEFALSATASQVERLVAAIRKQDGLDEDGTYPEPVVAESVAHWMWELDGTLTVTAHLTAVDGAHFLAGIVHAEYWRTRTADDPLADAAAIAATRDSAELGDADITPRLRRDLWQNVPYNVAPALLAQADAVIEGVGLPEVAVGGEVLIHEVDGVATIDGGPELRSAEREEVECDASYRTVEHGVGDVVTVGGRRMGPVLAWGRKRRAPNAALVRIVSMRDRGCRAPSCGRTRHLHIHHVRPWSNGGTTDPDNLILLCSQHHRALHNGLFSIDALGGQQFAFRGTHGDLLEEAPLHSTPLGWEDNPHVDPHAVAPTNGGRLDLGYATEVLYAAWAWKAASADEASISLACREPAA
ncbi:DUF222 domain-containing protein [Gordonia sp. (in: high G+C Gram-positive bacteria)]|uniref:DUF222 domain-containing protein n=1 Tax=Gordonia sp. (in: high G+C Gram-positive bacteria) TaxID=84139 RepID=UPI003F9ACDD7